MSLIMKDAIYLSSLAQGTIPCAEHIHQGFVYGMNHTRSDCATCGQTILVQLGVSHKTTFLGSVR